MEFRKKQSILGLIPLLKFVEEQGADPESLLKKHGLSIDRMSGEALIDQALELAIIEDVLNDFQFNLLGLEIGGRVTFTSYGTYAMLLMSAPNFLQALKAGIEFQALSLLFSHMTVQFYQHSIELRYLLPPSNGRLRNFIADRDFAGTYLFVKEFFDNPKEHLEGVGVARPFPLNAYDQEQYRKFADIELQFDQPYNWFRIPRGALSVKMKHGNQMAHQLYRVQGYELLRKFHSEHEDIVFQTKQVLSSYEHIYPSVPEVAKLFGMSERTYRRKLDQIGTSYREILDKHRCERCLDMLESKGNSVQFMSEALGYSDPASFLRAFKRWTGTTPKRYKLSKS